MRASVRVPSRTSPSIRSIVALHDARLVDLLLGDRQDVDPGQDRQADRLVVAVRIPDRAHLHVVRDDDAVPAQLLAKDAGDGRLRERGRMLRVEGRVEDVGGQHRVRKAVAHDVAERLQLDLRPGVGDVDDAQVRVAGRAAIGPDMSRLTGFSMAPSGVATPAAEVIR